MAASRSAVPLAARGVQPAGATIVRSPSVATMAMSRSPTSPAGTATVMVWGLPLPTLSMVSPPTHAGAAPVACTGNGAGGWRVTRAKTMSASVIGVVAATTRMAIRSALLRGMRGEMVPPAGVEPARMV